ncbi:MAG TPA: HAMP domain-containing sensor histidine kinase [Rhizomicrobium sp.]|nr:HAMP domain-containing sensor histidine kinase [Rhizomicrobium sp.]
MASSFSERQEDVGASKATLRKSVRAGIAAIATSLNPAPKDAWLAEAQLRMHRNGSRTSMLVMPIAGLLVALAFRPWVSFETRAAWWLVLSATCLAVHIVNGRLDRMTGHDAETVGRKSRIATVSSVFFMTVWCSMSIAFWPAGEPIGQMLLVLILACSMAGTIVATASHPPIAVAGLVIHAIFLIAPPALNGSKLDVTLALLSTIFTVLLIGNLVALVSGVNRLLRLEQGRAELLHDLRNAKHESDRERGRAAMAGRAKSQFLSHMNHELRTPMNAILGFSEIIEAKAFGDDVDKYAEYAAIIHDSGEHLLSLIDGMIDLAKIDSGKVALREADIDLAQIIGEVVETLEPKAQEARIALTRRVERGLPMVFADERALRQIIFNLLSNALKFTQAEGRVSVFAQMELDGRLAFGVEDTGIGIPREDHDRVFERFGHGRHDIKEQHRGTGLGLAVVKGFAEAHDGRVKLESEVGVGTRLTVYLPHVRVVARPQARLAG